MTSVYELFELTSYKVGVAQKLNFSGGHKGSQIDV